MANTYFDYPGDGSETLFAITFDYLEDEHVTVELDGVATTDFTINTAQPTKRVEMNTPPANGVNVRIRRKSQPDTNLVDFVNGSVLTESELDRAYLHNRYLAEESAEQNDDSLRLKAGAAGWEGLNKKILNIVDPTSDQDAATKNYVDETVAGVVLGEVPDGSITDAKLDTDAVTTVKIEDGAVTSAKISTTDTNFNISDTNNNIGTGALADSSYQLTVDGGTGKDPIYAKGNQASAYVDLNIQNESASGSGARVRLLQGSNNVSLQYQESNERLSLVLSDGSFPATAGLNISCISGTQGVVEASGSMYSNPNSNVDLGTATNQWGTIYASGLNINGADLLLDEDAMTSNSDTQGATQQSIKAYVDTQVGSAVSKYASSWFNDTTGLANGGTYSFTHGLGTDDAQVQVWMATSSAGANIKLVPFDTDATDLRGASITALSTTSVTVQLTNAGWTHLNADGSRTTGNWGTTYTHIKVVVIG